MEETKTAVALCAVGAEKIVSNEVRKLGLKVIEGGFGKVRFNADLQGLYRALIGLRAADRLLLEIASFEALDFDALFEGVRHQPWEDYVPKNFGLRVEKVRTNRSMLRAETSIQAIVHKAAAERLCTKRGINRLPESSGGSGPNAAQNIEEAELRVYIEKNQVSVLMDLSGEPLFKRGYRMSGGIAPLRETTAAAILLHSLWRRKFALYDPFCGSGTIVAEAAMFAWDLAPGLGRRFSLSQLLIANRGVEKEVREEFLARVDFSRPICIGGSDLDTSAVAIARGNMERAIALAGGQNGKGGFTGKMPAFNVIPMEEAKAEDSGAQSAGYIVTNPPYGRRLGDVEFAEKTYSEMRRLSGNFPGWKLVVITDHSGFESFFGRKADSCREITNGAIQSFLYQYEKL